MAKKQSKKKIAPPKGKEKTQRYQAVLANTNEAMGISKHQSPAQRKKTQEIFERRMEVAKLMTEYGYNDAVIARLLEVSTTTIRTDREWLNELWLKTALNDIEIAKQQLIRRKEFILDETRRAWERSKSTTKSLKKKDKNVTGGKGGKTVENEEVETINEHLGNPEYLKIFDKAAEDIAELQGLKKDQIINKINITLPPLPGDITQYIETEEQRKKKQKLMDAEDTPFVDIEELDEQDIRDRQEKKR